MVNATVQFQRSVYKPAGLDRIEIFRAGDCFSAEIKDGYAKIFGTSYSITTEWLKMKFKESTLAHQLLDGLTGLEIGGSAHNPFGLNTRNVDYTDDMTTIFKLHEVELCGEAMPVDIVAPGDKIPLEDKSVDFVISSHVIEHFFDPIGAIKEWIRLSRKYIFIICPQPDALDSDRQKEVTPLEELIGRHEGRIPPPEIDTHEHYTRWYPQGFCNMCMYYGWEILAVENPDQKVGNGFTIVLKIQQS